MRRQGLFKSSIRRIRWSPSYCQLVKASRISFWRKKWPPNKSNKCCSVWSFRRKLYKRRKRRCEKSTQGERCKIARSSQIWAKRRKIWRAHRKWTGSTWRGFFWIKICLSPANNTALTNSKKKSKAKFPKRKSPTSPRNRKTWPPNTVSSHLTSKPPFLSDFTRKNSEAQGTETARKETVSY